MEKVNKSEFRKLRQRIIDRIAAGPEDKSAVGVSLSQLIPLGANRQSVRYHIKNLIDEHKIVAFIKNGGSGLKDDEICFSLKSEKYPQEVHDIKKLIKRMCSDDDIKTAASAYEEFVDLCIAKGIHQKTAENLACYLISSSGSDPYYLKEKVVYYLTRTLKEKVDEAYARVGESDTAPKSYFDEIRMLLNKFGTEGI